MKIALDISTISDEEKTAHGVRGIGSYTRLLYESLKKYGGQHEILAFTALEGVPLSADIVHYPYFDPFFRTLPLRKTSRTVVTVHDCIPLLFPEHFPAGIKGGIKWQLQKFLLQRADQIVCVSERTKRDCGMVAGVSSDKLNVVYSAASEVFLLEPEDKLVREVKKKYSLPESFLLYVGDATWNKNLPRLITSAVQADIPLVMAGKALVSPFDASNPWNSDLVTIGRLTESSKGVIKVGYLSIEELVSLYGLAKGLVMPSLYEGFGLPILEAMSASCPVITSKRGSLPEIAGDAAYYVDPESEKSIAEGMKSIFSDKTTRQSLIAKGKIQAKKFSWKKTALETISVYERAANV